MWRSSHKSTHDIYLLTREGQAGSAHFLTSAFYTACENTPFIMVILQAFYSHFDSAENMKYWEGRWCVHQEEL